jgi:hypothetical protein
MRPAFMPQLGEHFEHLAFKGMVLACHANLAGKVSEGESLSKVSSIRFPITN